MYLTICWDEYARKWALVQIGDSMGYQTNCVTRGQTLIAHASYPEVSNGTLKHIETY